MPVQLNEAILKMLLNTLKDQFLDEADQAVKDGAEILQRVIQIPFDENPDNEGQYRELLSVMGAAARDANLLD